MFCRFSVHLRKLLGYRFLTTSRERQNLLLLFHPHAHAIHFRSVRIPELQCVCGRNAGSSCQ